MGQSEDQGKKMHLLQCMLGCHVLEEEVSLQEVLEDRGNLHTTTFGFKRHHCCKVYACRPHYSQFSVHLKLRNAARPIWV